MRSLGVDELAVRSNQSVHDMLPSEFLTGNIVVRHGTLIKLGCLSDCGFGCFPYILGRDIGPTTPLTQTIVAVCFESLGNNRAILEIANPFRLPDECEEVTPMRDTGAKH